MLRTLSLGLLLGLSLGPAAGQSPVPNLTYSSWTKICERYASGESVCHTASFGNLEPGRPIVAAVLTEFSAGTPSNLRVVFPNGMLVQPGIRASVDDGQWLLAPYIACFSKGCMADIEASAELIGKLKTGQTLVLQGLNGKGQRISLDVPLADFAKAHDGPPATDAKLLHELQEQLPRPGQRAGEVTPKDLGHLIFSPWTKLCPANDERKACYTGKDARVGQVLGLPIAAAVLIEPQQGGKDVLRVTLPLGMQMPQGTRVIVDNGQPMTAPYLICFNNGCMADYDASDELIGQLKKGKLLTLQGIDNQGHAISPIVPLEGFAKAHDGPPTDQKVFEEQQRKLQEQLKKQQ
jgi:invasion protein IalB